MLAGVKIILCFTEFEYVVLAIVKTARKKNNFCILISEKIGNPFCYSLPPTGSLKCPAQMMNNKKHSNR